VTVDVAARLAQGRPSVFNTQSYVSACHALGYQHPDLTAHGAQIVEWYSGEDGLDLHALDADCAVLRAAASSADEALRVMRDGHAAVLSGWQGDSGSVAVEFIERHCSSGAAVAHALNVAASACEALRDGLGRLIDEKGSAAMSIDDRRAGERPAWLAAAATVTSGGAGRDEAVTVVTQQITPYVDTDIRTEWVAAMRSATAAVTAAYEDALRQLNAFPAMSFEVPGQFGAPSVSPQAVVPVAAQTVPAQTVPATAVPASAPPPIPIPDTAAAQPVPPTPLPEPPAALGAPPSTGMPAIPDLGGGLSGLVGQIADALGGLLEGIPDTPVDDELVEPPGEPVEKEPEPEDPETTEQAVPEEVPAAEELPAEQPVVTEAEPVETPPAPPPPEPPPEPLAAEQPEQPEQPEQTPCEIAADELAQVGQ